MKWRDRSGMTLMELLVALTLVAVIVAGLAASTRLGVQVLDRTIMVETTSPQIALRTRLRHWVRTIAPPSLLTSFQTGVTGDASSLTFVTLTPAPFAVQSAALGVTVFLNQDQLNLRITELDDEGEVLSTHERLLAEDIMDATFSYYSDDPDLPGWRESWSDNNRLPLLIRITANEGSNPAWPVFTVRLVFAQRR